MERIAPRGLDESADTCQAIARELASLLEQSAKISVVAIGLNDHRPH
jgi:hypothetical protein